MAKKRTYYKRPKNPKSIRLTERDIRIFETIHAYDGMMSFAQLRRLFFPGKWATGPLERLRLLYQNRYLDMPDDDNVHRVPQGETVYWLDTLGAEVVAGLHGLELKDFTWRKMGRWSLIAHDLAVNNFRLDVIEACEQENELALVEWIPESDFQVEVDDVTYTTSSGKKVSKQIRPDGFFLIRKPSKRHPGKLAEYAFLLEIDMGTESNVRFAREKVPRGTAYLKSEAYQQRFGVRYGRWVVVTTSPERLQRMKDQAERAGGEKVWYFTTFEQITPETILTSPIWAVSGQEEQVSLVHLAD